jgi:hypothetical protein
VLLFSVGRLWASPSPSWQPGLRMLLRQENALQTHIKLSITIASARHSRGPTRPVTAGIRNITVDSASDAGSRERMAGSASATAAALSLLMMSFGVPRGAKIPSQSRQESVGSPARGDPGATGTRCRQGEHWQG